MSHMSKHRCACCDRMVEQRLLMCFPHWRQVPADLQQRVNRAWFALNWGSFRNTSSARQDYLNARQAAIEAVKATATTTGVSS